MGIEMKTWGIAVCCVVLLCGLTPAPAVASLVVYDGFSTTATGTGDDYQADATIRYVDRDRVGCTGPWAPGGSFDAALDYRTRAAGLSYAGLTTTAGAVEGARVSSSSTNVKYIQRGLVYGFAPTDEIWMSCLFKVSGFDPASSSALDIMLVNAETKEFKLTIDANYAATVRGGGDYGSIIGMGTVAANATHMLVVRAKDVPGTDYDDLSIWLNPANLTNLGTPHYTGTGVFREQYAVDSITPYSDFRIQGVVNPVGYSAFVDEVRIGTTFETGLPSGGGTPGPADSLGVDLGRNTGQDFYNFWTEAPDTVVQWDAADKTNPSRSFDEFGRFTATFTEALEGNGSIDARLRSDVFGPRGNLLEDAFKDAYGLKMTLAGLEAGDYTITTYHHDNNNGNEFRGSVDVFVADTAGDRQVVNELMQTLGPWDDGYAYTNFTFNANGVDDVVLRFLNGDVPAEEGNETEVWMNGFLLLHEPAPPHPGDANADGQVDDVDASILGAHWQIQSGAAWGDGDFNADGKVNDKDAAILAAHWHYGVGEEASVPEPSCVVLLAGAVLLLAFCRRR